MIRALLPALLLGTLLMAEPEAVRAQPAPAQVVPQAAVPAAAAASPHSAIPRGASPRSAIPYKQDKQGGGSLAWQSLAGLVLASLAAYGIVLGLKKARQAPGARLVRARRMRVLESTRLSRRSALHVVDFDGEELLFAESEQGIALVRSRPAKDHVHA